MENYRLSVKNNCKNDIRKYKKIVENTQKTISNLTQQKATSFVTNKVEKLVKKVSETKELIKSLEIKIENIEKGDLDDEIIEALENEEKKLQEKLQVKNRRKKEIDKNKAERSVISKKYYEKNRQAIRKQRYNQRGWKSCYNYYIRTSRKLPNYMRNNLKNMPNNKGYFWRDIAFYGELPAERNRPTVLFQKERNGSMIIHEWTSKYYHIYMKKTKNDKKVLIQKKERRVKH